MEDGEEMGRKTCLFCAPGALYKSAVKGCFSGSKGRSYDL